MNRHDRKQWKSASTMADLGELVVAWLNGELIQTPGHLGRPDPETAPLVPALTLANRAGFVTNNSQAADAVASSCWRCCSWPAWVEGFASDATLAHLRASVAGTGLQVGACRPRKHCDHKRFGWGRCPWRECTGFWADCCPAVASEIRSAWYVAIQDPQPGRNDRLWPALERFAANPRRAA